MFDIETGSVYARELRQRAALAQIAFDSGDYRAALRNLTVVLSHADHNPQEFSDAQRAAFHKLAAKIYVGLEMAERAEAAIRTALSLHAPNNDTTPESLSDRRHLAEALRLRKRFDEAEHEYRECIAKAALYPWAYLEGSKASLGLGQVLIDQEKFIEADLVLQQTLSRLETLPKSDKFWYGRCLMTLARLRFGQNRTHEASDILEQGMAIIEPLIGPDHPLRAKALRGMGRIQKVEGNLDASQQMFAESKRVEQYLRVHDH